MILPEYVTATEVGRVCAEIGLDDWSKRKEAVVSEKEASKIIAIVNTEKMAISLEDFRMSIEVELEYGTRKYSTSSRSIRKRR